MGYRQIKPFYGHGEIVLQQPELHQQMLHRAATGQIQIEDWSDGYSIEDKTFEIPWLIPPYCLFSTLDKYLKQSLNKYCHIFKLINKNKLIPIKQQ